MMRAKTAFAILSIGTLGLTLAACSSSSTGEGEADQPLDPIRILDTYSWEPANTVFNDALTACAEELGTTIDRESVPFGDLNSKILQQASSRTLPDVIMVNNPDVQLIAETGALAPLGEFGLTGEGFIDGILDAGTYDGELYGLGPGVNTIALFYNKDLLDAAGIEPPQTWDELVAAADALTVGDTYGFAFSAEATGQSTWQWLPFLWSNGGDESQVATPEGEEALSLWKDLVDSGSVSASVVNWSQADVNDQFKAGKAAMMVNGPWQIPNLSEATDLNYGVVPIPVPNAGDTSITPLGGETWTVARTGNAAMEAASAKMVECLTSDDNQIAIAGALNYIPSKVSLADAYVEAQPQLADFVPLVQAGRALTGQLGSNYPTAANAIATAIQSSLTGQASVQDALQLAEGEIAAE